MGQRKTGAKIFHSDKRMYVCGGVKRILDVGCGFGDLNRFFKSRNIDNYSYIGVDVVEPLIREATDRNSCNGKANISYVCGDFLEMHFDEPFDYVVSSGVFNRNFTGALDNYSFIKACIDKAFDICEDVIAFDFLSDKVDYQYEWTFHSSPEKILGYAYQKSRNILLRNDYMPFEFALFIFKDDSFDKKDTVFRRYWETLK